MIKLLHSADWHLDSPIQGRTPEQTQLLRSALLALPGKLAALCRREGCQMMLLAGDLFDGPYTADSLLAVRQALEESAVPVFITPGNHDHLGPDSPWLKEAWPGNVTIFTQAAMECRSLPELGCRVYGAAFTGPDSGPLLEGFRAEKADGWAIGLLHGDPTQANSPYDPITQAQVADSSLDYLALGHIHKGGSFLAGSTLCAWPGCAAGRGFDELGDKGALMVTLAQGQAQSRFVPIPGPRFYDLQAPAGEDAAATLNRLLPGVGSQDLYRVTFTGESQPLDLEALTAAFARFPNLELRDRTVPPIDLWATAGDDTLEGIYFRLLQQAMEGQDSQTCHRIRLAAKLSRQILDNQEVKLP